MFSRRGLTTADATDKGAEGGKLLLAIWSFIRKQRADRVMKSKYVAIALVALAPLSAGAARAANLSGQAFVTAQGGERVTCAGREVTITADLPTQSAAAVHRTICDQQGHFAFDGLAMQGWTIHTAIKWDVRAKQGVRHLGGDLTYDVVLKSSDTSLVLNDRDVVTHASEGHELAQAGP